MSYFPDFSNFVYIADTTKVTGRFVALLALEATVLAAETVCKSSASTLTSMPIPAGTMVYGYFTDVKLTSGKVVAYIS
jgi:N-dimethylarginine dimethylaminohydrolase